MLRKRGTQPLHPGYTSVTVGVHNPYTFLYVFPVLNLPIRIIRILYALCAILNFLLCFLRSDSERSRNRSAAAFQEQPQGRPFFPLCLIWEGQTPRLLIGTRSRPEESRAFKKRRRLFVGRRGTTERKMLFRGRIGDSSKTVLEAVREDQIFSATLMQKNRYTPLESKHRPFWTIVWREASISSFAFFDPPLFYYP